MLFQPLLHTAIFVCVSISAAMTGLTNNTCTATGHQEYGGACPVMDATVNAEQGARQEVNSTCTYSRYKLSTGIGVSGQQTFKKPEPLVGCTRVVLQVGVRSHKRMRIIIIIIIYRRSS